MQACCWWHMVLDVWMWTCSDWLNQDEDYLWAETACVGLPVLQVMLLHDTTCLLHSHLQVNRKHFDAGSSCWWRKLKIWIWGLICGCCGRYTGPHFAIGRQEIQRAWCTFDNGWGGKWMWKAVVFMHCISWHNPSWRFYLLFPLEGILSTLSFPLNSGLSTWP